MRPLRFLLSLATCILAFFGLLFIGPWRASTQESIEQQSSIRAYFHWHTPTSLFPPTAVITLTDDNSTVFLARPAAFGPLLPANSLSGQLWIGSGFGDDRLGRTGSAEGDLGCSDVPGWTAGDYGRAGKSLSEAKSIWASSKDGESAILKRDESSGSKGMKARIAELPDEDDGTDDHLHHPLMPSDGLSSSSGSSTDRKPPTHADIQSLQESAEIAGKIVLLSRGGCGFLEKVKWVQRRGGIALIVGDDMRGEPLVTMYARGDTSNITIPSLFASHTTAHLLSGLIPAGGNAGSFTTEEGAAVGDKTDTKVTDDGNAVADRPTFTASSSPGQRTVDANSQLQGSRPDDSPAPDESSGMSPDGGWLRSWFSPGDESSDVIDSRRPPTSGDMGWVLQQDFDDDDDAQLGGSGSKHTTTTASTPPAGPTPDSVKHDDFVIGVQDWRDPDLLLYHKEQYASTSVSTSETTRTRKATATASLRGGSITPGSGEYVQAEHEVANMAELGKVVHGAPHGAKADPEKSTGSWLGHVFGSAKQHSSRPAPNKLSDRLMASSPKPWSRDKDAGDEPEVHEGLWVTLTPTSISSSPFFDTLLVLVVSPLVTLTVVYALLLLRSRIRRRRWRAPKSVVERLPVRTYHTMHSASMTSSTTSSISSPVTAATPLLQSPTRPINTRARPRSRTVSGVPGQQNTSIQTDSTASPSLDQLEEKRAAGLAEWRRRYGGRQRECVVCLEEYIDGVSRVMSLPCGHEFHAECMYVHTWVLSILTLS